MTDYEWRCHLRRVGQGREGNVVQHAVGDYQEPLVAQLLRYRREYLSA